MPFVKIKIDGAEFICEATSRGGLLELKPPVSSGTQTIYVSRRMARLVPSDALWVPIATVTEKGEPSGKTYEVSARMLSTVVNLTT